MYEPLFKHRPPFKWTNGDLAAKVGADLGLPPDPEQQWLLDTIFAEKAVDRPACFEVGAVSPRQNIKTSTFGIAALADLFVFDVERHLWTAHHGDTLKGTFNDFRSWIKSNPEYDEQVTFYEGHQDMSIVHKDTEHRIDFQSRTGKAGRGLTGVKRITLDEALYLEPKHVGAVYPTMLTRPGAQVRIGSSAGLLVSEQLRRIRDRGRAGKDGRMAYVEYGAERKPCHEKDCTHAVGSEGCALDDRDLWWQANCALWAGRITEESLEDQRNSLPPEEFMREFFSWWEDPADGDGYLDFAAWKALGHPDLKITEPNPPLALDMTPDLAWCSIGAAGRDGEVVDLELVAHQRGGSWVVPWFTDDKEPQRRKYRVGIMPGAPAGFLIEPLRKAGIDVYEVSSQEYAHACTAWVDAFKDGRLRHRPHPDLDAAVEGAQVTNRETRTWDRKSPMVVISPLVAVTLAFAMPTGPPREFFGAWA